MKPLGAETRLGDALEAILADHAGGPLAGVLVLSDGGQNRGVDPLALADALAAAKAPVATIGVGSTEPRRNVRIQELIAPSRAYPDDKTVVRAIVQGESYDGRTVDVELYGPRSDARRRRGANRRGAGYVRERRRHGGSRVRHRARRRWPPRTRSPRRRAAPTTSTATTIAARPRWKSSTPARACCCVASGATRDYRFLRNQLRRDRHVTVDVLLQGAPPGISQDADKILQSVSLDEGRAVQIRLRSSRSTPTGRSSTPARSTCSRNGSPRKPAA